MRVGYILAIDEGTTGTAVLIFDHAGHIRGRAYSEFQHIQLHQHSAQQQNGGPFSIMCLLTRNPGLNPLPSKPAYSVQPQRPPGIVFKIKIFKSHNITHHSIDLAKALLNLHSEGLFLSGNRYLVFTNDFHHNVADVRRRFFAKRLTILTHQTFD